MVFDNLLELGIKKFMEECTKDTVYTCYHCGNTGLLKYIGGTCWKNEEYDIAPNGIVYNCFLIEHEDWDIFECPVCHKPVVVRTYTFDANDDLPEVTIEFPNNPIHRDGVPTEIATAFESAVKTKGIDPAICLLSLRRVLEMICKDKKATGNNLESKIKHLIETKVLPDMFNDACWIIRTLGNKAAHADTARFSDYEAEQVIEFLSIIIEYLYSVPIRITKMKERLMARNS